MNYSYKGKILISTPDASGDVFSRSVVLILEHDENGAFGLILNKQNIELTDAVQQVFMFPVDVYEGGPMENDKVFFILKDLRITENYSDINKEFYITEDMDAVMDALLRDLITIEDIKVFSGYSGWGPLQLESEIQRKMWTLVDVYNLDYTLPNDQNLWKNIMQNLGGEFLLWANAPENVSLN